MARNIETRPRGVIGPASEEMRQANSGELAPRGITRIILKVTKHPTTAGIAAGTTLAAASSYMAYDNIPGVHQFIDSLGHQISSRWDSIMGNKPEPKSTQPVAFQEPLLEQPSDTGEKTNPGNNSFEQTKAQQIVEQNTNKGVYEMTMPPGRQAENLSEIPTSVKKEDIPNISKEEVFPDSLPQIIKTENLEIIIPPSVVVGFNAFPEGRWIMSAKKGEEMRESLISPYATISGILVAKEKQPDGSVMFAIELPYSDSPRDILERNPDHTTLQSTSKTRKSSGFENARSYQETTVQGGIVWIKLFKGTNPTHYPFETTVVWGQEEFKAVAMSSKSTNKAGHGEEPLAKYAKIGDLIRANISLSADPDSPDILKALDNYVNRYGYGDNVDASKKQLKQTIEDNMQNARELMADSGKNVPLDEQLGGKRYVFTPDAVGFLPK